MTDAMGGFDAFVDACLVVNGIYDILCAFAILYFPHSSPGRLHLHVFKRDKDDSALLRRIFAYWVCTYGIDRLVAGLYTSTATDVIATVSYLIEAVTYYNEVRQGSVDSAKAQFVYVASLALALATAVRLGLTVGAGVSIGLKVWSVTRAVVFAVSAAGGVASIFQALRQVPPPTSAEESPESK